MISQKRFLISQNHSPVLFQRGIKIGTIPRKRQLQSSGVNDYQFDMSYESTVFILINAPEALQLMSPKMTFLRQICGQIRKFLVS